MLTARGWWFLLITLTVLLAASLLPGQTTLAVITLALLFWFLAEWLRFAIGALLVARQLSLVRELHDARGPVDSLWAGRQFQVMVRVRLRGLLRLVYARIGDHAPYGIETPEGIPEWEGEVTPERPIHITYPIACPATGLVRFEGLAVKLADLQGFFYHATFVPDGRIYRVLPVLESAGSATATHKPHNLLPPPGVHRQRRPGGGGELLDLRDYLPGDPPKLIAWKVSARRDRLITKEFESEVPVRCTLFVDASNSVRLGPPGQNALARLVEIGARVAQSAAGNRDLVGLVVFDEQSLEQVRPARSRRHLVDLLRRLADAAARAPAAPHAPVERLLPLAYSFAQEVYPDWLRSDRNAFPFWLPWLSPPPAWAKRFPRPGDRLFARFPLLLPAFFLLGVSLAGAIMLLLARWLSRMHARPEYIAGIMALAALALLLVLIEVPRMLFRQRRRHYRWRKQLSAILSVEHGLAPGGLSLLLEDDFLFARHMQRWLAEHHLPVPLTLYDPEGHYQYAAAGKIDVLAQGLLRAVGKGRDNELYVLLVDLLELEDRLGPLLRAIKVAMARHHQVLVVCPWPPGLPLPGQAVPPSAGFDPVQTMLQMAVTDRFHHAFHRLRRTLARLGVLMICAAEGEPARLIVDKLDRLRSVRSGPAIKR